MNPFSMYPGLTDNRCFAIPSDDFDDLTIIAMDEDIGIIGGANDMKEARQDAKATGWKLVKAPKRHFLLRA